MDPPPLPHSVRPDCSSPLKPAPEALFGAREVVLGVEDVEGPGGVDATAQHRACLLWGEKEGKKKIITSQPQPSPSLEGSQAPRRARVPPFHSPSVPDCS